MNAKYVCGLMFDVDLSQVLLIRKNRPVWQAGKLNGIGGKIEDGEDAFTAMRREFREEAGIDWDDRKAVVVLSGNGRQVHFFKAIGPIANARSMTDESIVRVPIATIQCMNRANKRLPVHGPLVRTLEWIIPLSLDDDLDVPIAVNDRHRSDRR